uniref:NADH-ubiquinone oxidoreductase chain 6 n=1 Tax=Parankylopteryx sp. YJ-2017 TaxID=2025299 RepID=A0A343ISN7_9NEOP|nr:NADH dehydrogenase subunit 6 [Parankylopteryx sp. YJ-2017]
MYQFLTLMCSFLTINFIMTNHPLAMGLNLLMMTIMISMLCSFMTYSYWFSYILFLIMMGGMLILFLYVTSLASNELFKFNWLYLIMMLMFLMILMSMVYYMDNFFWFISNIETMNLNFYTNLENENNLIKLYNNPTMNMTLLMINYLFLTLIIVVKLTNINHGPLRQYN